MSLEADPAPLYEALAAERAALWEADREWDVKVHEEPEPWGMGPTPLTLMIDRLTAELPPTTVRAVEAEVDLERWATYGDQEPEGLAEFEKEVNGDAGTDADRPVHGADVADEPERPELVAGDGPGDPDDQG